MIPYCISKANRKSIKNITLEYEEKDLTILNIVANEFHNELIKSLYSLIKAYRGPVSTIGQMKGE